MATTNTGVDKTARKWRGILLTVGAATTVAAGVIFGFWPANKGKYQPDATNTSKLAASLAPSVVRIEALDANGKVLKAGTGFFVQADGVVSTCAHVISGAAKVRVLTLTGAEFKFRSLLKIDEAIDLALISVEASGVPALIPAVGETIAMGTPIAVLANPLGLNGSFSTGVVSAVRTTGEKGSSLLQVTAPISPGSSGAPVVTASGVLIGMVGTKATHGEGIAFALPADAIARALEGVLTRVPAVEDSPLLQARRRYLPGAALAADPDWNDGDLPESAAQRLAVLRKLRSRYQDDVIIRIEIARALSDDRNYDAAMAEFAAILREDPANRFALVEACKIPRKAEDERPMLRAAVAADPLNFRAREELAATFSRDYLSEFVESNGNAAVAPFFLPGIERTGDALLHMLLHESAQTSSWDKLIGDAGAALYSIQRANALRRIVALAARSLSEQTEAALRDFVEVAKNSPEASIPYCHELLAFETAGSDAMRTMLSGNSGRELASFYKTIVEKHRSVAEAYLLDYAAVDSRKGLALHHADRAVWECKIDGADLGQANSPFDLWAMIYFRGKANVFRDGDLLMSPGAVLAWKQAMEEHFRWKDELSEAGSRLLRDRQPRKYAQPVLFQFWLACEKERLESDFASGKPGRYLIAAQGEETDLKKIHNSLSDCLRRQDAAEAVRLHAAKSKGLFWNWFGHDLGSSLKEAFEQAAR